MIGVDAVSIKAIEAFGCGNPQYAIPVARHIVDIIITQPFSRAEMIKCGRLCDHHLGFYQENEWQYSQFRYQQLAWSQKLLIFPGLTLIDFSVHQFAPEADFLDCVFYGYGPIDC